MAADLQLQIKGLSELQKAFGSLPLQETLDISIRKVVIMLQGEAIKEAPVDRGQLRSSFTTSFAPFKGILTNPKEYAVYVHEGTKPHAAPFQEIKDWANRKGLPRFPVWLSIKRKGTKANNFLQRAVDTVDPEIDRIFNAEIDRVLSNYDLT